MKHYLSICAIYRDEAPYLEEWVEFHRLVGVERFFLYDNMSTDEHAEVLEPFVREGSVVVHPWEAHPGQGGAYEHCLDTYRADSRWIAFIDLDEYLFSPLLRPLPELLAEYEQWPAVGVNRHTFGSSGHKEMPEGLLIENYVMSWPMVHSIKSIVDPSRTVRYRNPHAFVYRDGRGRRRRAQAADRRLVHEGVHGRAAAHQPLLHALGGRVQAQDEPGARRQRQASGAAGQLGEAERQGA